MKNRQERERYEQLNRGLQESEGFERQDNFYPLVDNSEIMDGVLQTQDVFDADIVEDNEESVFAKWLAGGFHFAIEYFEKADIESWKASGKMSFIVDLVKECLIVKDKIVLVSHSITCLGKDGFCYRRDVLSYIAVFIDRLHGEPAICVWY